jgi:TolB-like protein/Tfp pilus assembly protein PilF
VTPERWNEIEGIFERALELPTNERTEFLRESCNDDEELRREVESLLESHASAGTFIDEPCFFIVDEDLKDDERDVPVGQLIGAYRIVREIGRGGMGAVYLAERADEQYHKQVAIKLIKRGMDTDSVLRHFRNERQILASFDHPNIGRLFDGGTANDGLPYFVMEYIEGLPIDEYCAAHDLSVIERLKLFREVCAAVSYAHRRTVIHRDIKMSNILVTSDGTPKLLDFGIAKILQPGAGAEALLTMTGMRPMTPEYASPEQVRGESVTIASDVYSLGVVLYKLLTGSSPYRLTTRSSREIEQAITEQAPARPSTVTPGSNPKARTGNRKLLRGDLDNILLTALRKEPERRYASVEQFSEDIQRHLDARPVLARKDAVGYRAAKFVRRNPVLVSAASICLLLALAVVWLADERFVVPRVPPPHKSIAVLPFQNLSADPENAYFADGIQEEILMRLSKIADLKVISRTSVQRYKTPARNLREIARQLGVAHIVEGTVQKAADQLRVNVELINAENDSHLWADKYDRKANDLFFVESEIATKITQALQAKITGSEQTKITIRPTEDPEAHELYLKGRFFFAKRTGDDLKKAIQFFKQAIARDPNYAAAYAGLADACSVLPAYAGVPVKQAFADARAAAEKAVAIDNELADGHSALGLAYAVEFDLHSARREFEHAIELDPNYALPHYNLGFLVLGPLGQFDAAIAEMKRAVELDPLSAIMNANLAYCYIFGRRYPEAITAAKKAMELEPGVLKGRGMLGLGLELTGHFAEAATEYERTFQLSGGDIHPLFFLAHLYATQGDRTKALEMFERAKQNEQKQGFESPYGHALVSLALGNHEEAIKWLGRSYETKEVLTITYIKADPLLDPLRGNPAFEQLANRVISDFDRQSSAGKTIDEKSIAVLPFQNLSGDPENAYFADGIQEEILTLLSKIADLKVISRTSTQRYKNTSEPLSAIAEQLGVAHVVEGTVQKAADQVRVNVQLINAQTDSHLWADKFDRKAADIFSAESEIATKIAQTLQAKLTGSEQRTIAASHTQNSEAHELYLKGRFFMKKGTTADAKKAIELFKQALAKDPNYAAAYAGMADLYVYLPIYVGGSAREAIANARAAAEKALAIDDELAEAHSALGFAFAVDHDWRDARREFERAIQLDPNFAGAHYYFGFYVLGPLGDLDGAIAEMKRAIELDPLSPGMLANLGHCYTFARRYPEAIAAGRKAVELDARAPKGNGIIALGLDLSGEVSEAIAQYEKAFEVTDGDYHLLPYLSRLYGLRGERAKALQISEQAKQIEAKQNIEWAYGYALVAIGQGDYEEAINWLERSYRTKELLTSSYFKFDPVLDSLRGNPRFEKLLQQIDADFTRNAEPASRP